MASSEMVPTGASTRGHVLVYMLLIIVFVVILSNKGCWVKIGVNLERQRQSMASTARVPIRASTSGHVTGVVGIPSDPPVICWL